MGGSITFGVLPLLLLYGSGGGAQYSNCTSGRTDWIADGYCDSFYVVNNVEECGYDGGDCCECTCKDTQDNSCGVNGYSCIDPNSGCTNPLAVQFSSCIGNINDIGDGRCDSSLNNENCGYDGGDCCECTCADGPDYSCADNHFLCLDPASGCVDPIRALYSNCTGDLAESANGFCQDFNNNEDCGYDGGDCCECTCVDGPEYSCSGIYRFDCVDPDAPNALYDCEETLPVSAVPCASDLRGQWLVETTADAKEMAEAVYCANGSFDVEWRGDIVVAQTIHIVDGTVLKITGVGSNPAMNGGGTSRIFTVVNASLHLDGVMIENGKAISGGAIMASGSILTLNHTVFSGNIAWVYGGALEVSGGSSVFSRESAFLSNTAGSGGAVYMTDASSASWTGDTIFSDNIAENSGALHVGGGSSVSWAGVTEFIGNVASALFGGALQVKDSSSASWSGAMSFKNNSAEIFAGAVHVSDEGSISWNGSTQFSNNSVLRGGGGALVVITNSDVSWSGLTTFSDNSAHAGGGALLVYNSSSVSWSRGTMFSNNKVAKTDGGAIGVIESVVSWNGKTTFLANNAAAEGGAIYALESSIYWSTDTIFSHNAADEGGAILLTGGSRVEWIGKTTFSFNSASSDGGAIGLKLADSVASSALVINGTTSFTNNTCGANGGGMAVQGMSSIEFETTNITFIANSAKVSGGAIFISGSSVGPVVRSTSFIRNTAQVGGGVYVTGSGTASIGYIPHPTTFQGCSFVGNVADTSGGAVNSALGQDVFLNSSFVGNRAKVGGALQLAGSASLDRCSFKDNVSGVGGGPAVSNIGSVSDVSNSAFVQNILSYDQGTFLTFSQSSELFEVVCVGCPDECDECHFDERVPMCIGLSEAGVGHADSPGGVITVEELVIHEGYWRATETSTNVLECYNRNACLGGVKIGSCSQGYEGPYCSVCNNDYTGSVGFSCSRCSDSTTGIVVIGIIILVCVVVGIALALHLLSGGMENTERGLVGRIIRIVPVQAVKNIIVAWQILTQFTSVTSTTFPAVYQSFLDLMDVLNFDLGWILSTGCIVDVNFHGRMLVSTLVPIAVMIMIWGTYTVAVVRHSESEESLQHIRHKHMSAVILVAFLVYSSVSSAVLQMFDCEHLDDGNNYLRADYTILCDSLKHKALQVYAGVMIIIYPVGIPTLYSLLLFRSRSVLTDEHRRGSDVYVQSTSNLWKPYKPSRFYFEVVECARRILLTGAAMLSENDTAAKVAATLMIGVIFMVVVEVLAPYESRLDVWISRAGHGVVCTSMYFALLLKVDVSNERQDSQRAFEGILATTHVGMIFAVLIEIMVTAWSSLKPIEQREHPRRLHSGRNGVPPVDHLELDSSIKKVEEGPPVDHFELEASMKVEEDPPVDHFELESSIKVEEGQY